MLFLYIKKDIKVISRLGIPCATLVGWVKAKERSGESAFPGKGHLTMEEERFRALERANEKWVADLTYVATGEG
ncbi:MAG: hypothetical protein LEGION0403_FIIPPAGN_02417 [Legionella sp.]